MFEARSVGSYTTPRRETWYASSGTSDAIGGLEAAWQRTIKPAALARFGVYPKRPKMLIGLRLGMLCCVIIGARRSMFCEARCIILILLLTRRVASPTLRLGVGRGSRAKKYRYVV